jgi:L-fucose isomerase-like protein
MTDYEVVRLEPEERERLERAFDDLMVLAESRIPAVRAAARAAVAHVAQALNGQGIGYELYTGRWNDAG